MASVPVPKDLSKVKSKVFFNLTTRQIICFGGGALVGVPLFLLLKDRVNSSLAAILMVLVMMPFFLFAMFEKNGEPLEKVIGHYVRARFGRSRVRPYQTDNFYAAIARQMDAEREVNQIVQKAKNRRKAHTD